MSTTFPENEVALVRDYVNAAGGDPAGPIGSLTAALQATVTGAAIQEHNPFHPQILINKAAVRCLQARLRTIGFLNGLTTVLAACDAMCQNLAKHEYGLAQDGLAAIPLGPAVTPADLSDAFATNPIGYIQVLGTPAEPQPVEHTLPGYAGPAADLVSLAAAAELVGGGPERDRQLSLLQAEIEVGRGDLDGLVSALGRYLQLLPANGTTPWDRFGMHLDLFAGFASADAVSTASPRDKFIALRAAFAHLNFGDRLLRSQRGFGDDERAAIGRIYDSAVSLVRQIDVAADNPRRQEIESRASQQQAKLQSRSNVLGLWDGFVPVQRYTQLEQDATHQIQAAKDSATSFKTFLTELEQATEQQLDLQFQQKLEQTNLQILDVQQQNATLGVDKLDEQLEAIDDQSAALEDDLGLSPFKALLDNLSAGLNSKSDSGGTVGSLGVGMGLITTLLHASAQREELAHQRRMAELERQIGTNQEIIVGLEQEMSQQRLAYYAEKLAFLADKALNADLLATLADLEERRAERQLDAAIFLAYVYERALAFFLGEPNIRFIAFDYRDRPGGIFDAARALGEDFDSVLSQRDQADQEKFDFFEQAVSLRESYPLQFARFLQTGKMTFEYSLYELSKLRPATHQCRLREVGVEVKALVPVTGFSGTLTHRGRFLVRDRTATLTDPNATRLVPTDAQLADALDAQRRLGLPVAAVGGVLLYDLDPDTKELSQDTQFVSHVPPDQNTLHVFEGHGPTGLWELEIHDFDHLGISDVVLHFAIVSRESDIDTLGPKVTELVREYESELAGGQALDRISAISLRQDFPDTYFALPAGAAQFALGPSNLPGSPTAHVEQVLVQVLDSHGKGVPGIGLEISRPDAGFDLVRTTQADGFSEDLDAPPTPAQPDFSVAGTWQIRLADPSQFAGLGDVRLFVVHTAND